MTEAWPTLDHVFSSGGLFTKAKHELEKGRVNGTLLNKYPVDLILVDRGQFHTPSSAHQVPLSTKWEILVENATEKNRPKVVIESWPEKASMWEEGPMAKGPRTLWQRLGFFSRFQRIDATQVGGAVKQKRLLVV